MKTAELTGALLDYWVGKTVGYDCDIEPWGVVVHAEDEETPAFEFSPSTNWAQGGPIIEREGISLMPDSHMDSKDAEIGFWLAQTWKQALAGVEYTGQSLLVAAMRAYVASKFGDEVPAIEGQTP